MPIDYTKRPKDPEPTPQGGGGQAGPGGVSLSKVTLTKSAPAVSLTKQGTTGGQMRVNLNWNARPPGAPAPSGGGGFLKRLTGGGGANSGAIDLDLGCLYEYTDGSKGVVQALGNAFRDQHSFGPEPIVRLDGDDRSGNNTGGENLFINLSMVKAIKRILVFAFIYEGTPNWAGAQGVVTLFPVGGPEVEVKLDDSDPSSRMCAIALVESVGGEIVVRREVQYLPGGQKLLDERYGWGMQWAAGRK